MRAVIYVVMHCTVNQRSGDTQTKAADETLGCSLVVECFFLAEASFLLYESMSVKGPLVPTAAAAAVTTLVQIGVNLLVTV